MRRCLGLTIPIVFAILLGSVLSVHPLTDAAPMAAPAGTTDQEEEIVAQLKEVNAQLKDFAVLLRSGKVKVTVVVNPDAD